MTRKHVLQYIKIAGYHNDQRSFTRLYCENHVSFVVARKTFNDGAEAKQAGVKCGCSDCNAGKEVA